MSENKPVMPKFPLIAKEGIPFIAIAAMLFAATWVWGYGSFVVGGVGVGVGRILSIVFGILFIFTINFFRNPDRTPPAGDDLLISPADGKVISIGEVDENRFLNKKMKRVCIFMNVLNVHVNRVPMSGKVKSVHYNPGKFLIGYAEKASLDNEQNAVVMQDSKGRDLIFIQIAGFVARRIICYLKGGEDVTVGERFGLIRFGSRVDIYLPLEANISVKVGDKTTAGETIIAKY